LPFSLNDKSRKSVTTYAATLALNEPHSDGTKLPAFFDDRRMLACFFQLYLNTIMVLCKEGHTDLTAGLEVASQVGRHIADRRTARYAYGSDVEGACCGCKFDPRHAPVHRLKFNLSEKKAWAGARNISNQIVSIQP